MTDNKKIRVLGIQMHGWTMRESVDEIRRRLRRRQFTQHVVVNVAKIINMRQDAQLRRSIESCDIINIDGMGVVWGARILGYSVPERVAGIDLFHGLLSMSVDENLPVFLLGAREDVVEKTVERVRSMYPGLTVAGYHHGYFWDDELAVVNKIKASGAKLLFVAITSPRKENFINRWKEDLGVDFVMGVGGTFDVVAGKVKRAPLWMQKYGLEWLFRVSQEPRRMWRRYLITNTKFVCIVLNLKMRQLFWPQSSDV